MAELRFDASSIKPNSHKYHDEQAAKAASERREERDKLSPIVRKGGVVSTKKPLSQKFAEFFITEDTSDIKNYILMDVIIPGIKNTILDIMEMAFYGTVSRNERTGRKRGDTTNYRSCYRGSSRTRRKEQDDDRPPWRDDRLDYHNIVLLNRDDTEEVIDQLHRRIRKYGAVSIAELFDLIDEPSNYNDNNWGWKDERDIGLRRVANGFLIKVAEAEYLD